MFGRLNIMDVLMSGLLLAALCFFIYGYLNGKRARTQAEAAAVAEASEVAATTYVNEYKRVSNEAAAKRQRTTEVLSAHPDVRDSELPDDVTDLLRHDSGSTRAVPK